MKKSTKILGSVALSAALVMGTAVPAFADDTPKQGELTNGSGSAETAVNITTYTTQINVTVPMSLAFALNTNGGPGKAPDDWAYKMTNTSKVPVYVQSAKVEMKNNWVASETAYASEGGALTGSEPGNVYALFKVANQSNSFTLKDASAKTLNWLISGEGETSGTYSVTVNSGTPYTSLTDLKAAASNLTALSNDAYNAITNRDTTSWAALASAMKGKEWGEGVVFTEPTSTGDNELNIVIENPSSSMLKNKTASETPVNIASITYTIATTAAATEVVSG